MTTFIALLRGINVGGHRKLPMAGLRTVCEELGFTEIKTYIQSGNVVFSGAGKSPAVEAALEKALEERFGFAVDVIVRTAAQWPVYVKTNPFAEDSAREPHRVMLALSKAPPREEAVARLRERAVAGERLEAVGEALWLHYGQGVAGSKLSPALIDRLVGSPVTARNWRTVLKLAELAGVTG